MRELTEEEVALVADHLATARLPTALHTDLLDHLCCEVERHLARGTAFGAALTTTTSAWPPARLRSVKKDLQFTTKTKPMLIRFSAAAAILAALFLLSPFSLPTGLEPCTVPELAPLVPATTVLSPAEEESFDPPAASPIAGMDMEKDISSGFGMRIHPVMKKRQHHRGIDLKAKIGTPVLATADGEIIHAGPDRAYGITVRIRHADGYTTVYAHLESHAVTLGQQVKLGDTIAAVGSTGASTAPHLHYEVLKDERPVDPLALLND